MIDNELKKRYQGLTLKKLNDELILSCGRGCLEEVRYLLTSSDLKENAEIDSWSGECFLCACGSENIELVDFMLNSPELKQHANVHMFADRAFSEACKKNRIGLLDYFINVLKIERTEYINDCLEKYPEIKSKFETR